MKINILFPGRHHLLTKFQEQYLEELIENGYKGREIGQIIFAVTSSNHENTRRNPIPLYLRSLAIDKFAERLKCEVKIYPIPHVGETNKFARYVLSQIFYQSGDKLNPKNTVLACSTPPIIKEFKKIGFENCPVELIGDKKNKYATLRPYEIMDILCASGEKWREDGGWKKYAHPASQQVYLEYNLGDTIIELYKDALLTEDADITETRDYSTYAASMDKIADIKFKDIKPFVKEGKIVDVGCSTGSLIQLLAKEFTESDIIGVEAVRRFYEYCRLQEYNNPFVFFYRRNVTDQNFKANTINTFIYSSVLHEVYSYINEKTLLQVLKNSFNQLQYGGRLIIRDVVGPEKPNDIVLMRLNEKDGQATGSIKQLSTYAKFFQFVKDFKPRKIKFKTVIINKDKYVKLRLQDAYEYMSKMTYIDNWASEMHEEFGYYSFSKWQEVLKKNGFKIADGSHTFASDYIIKNHYEPRAHLFSSVKGRLRPLPYPPTNMVLVGEKID